jgi:bifunctional ADP-heptose synthase (sugar kinase/adenylyltransferase)
MENKTNRKERVFSVELNSKRNLKNVTFTNGSFDSVLFEGTLGELVQASFKERVILEIVGKNGTLRVDLTEDEISKSEEQKTIEASAP